MKKILFLLSLWILSSCSNDFLEVYPEAALNEGTFYQSEAEYILLANGCYVPMRDYEKVEHWVMAELPSDNASFQYNTATGEASKGVIDQFVLAADNVAYANFWNLSYNGITRCNKLLSEVDRPGVTWSKESYKERCSGEALFLRALYYFNLVRQFGGVPLVLEPITAQEAVGIKRSTEEQVYETIINDLTQAAAHFANANDVAENGRANEGAALALLGKVYLTTKKYTEAEQALKSVVASGKYILLPNYADLFNPASKDFKETIFAIQYSENSVELANRFIFWFAPWTSAGAVTNRPNISLVGGGWNQPTDDLINAFEPGDKRKDVSIKYWTGKDWDAVVRAIPYCGKYQAPLAAADDRTSDNLPVLRYSDVLLLLAEALNAQGRTGEAIGYVQQVRERAGLTEPLTNYDQAGLEILIAKERQVEFCFENQRWYDLKRTGKALEIMTAHGIREKAKKSFLYGASYTITPQKLLAPIPQEQILLNQLEQNPGY
ncbi:RagB/SusD family nutrient uptake outer membrane protein [Rhodocytophaga rosea]|uniref:RagB/SusD family nutrient uptake outer membrane protein n=1 Tax=Rhodocytophaga rosea TaxID=2704465 RepID=A0A6C0GI67_9BACT|nr:RagB/SusD family nutrient uptake outer membrane protein [Rhodocytophaga rosea]QHT67637.1 RagB/SusD family nutrient uptake outer membrane protein [Rhodocytophaga rosea]